MNAIEILGLTKRFPRTSGYRDLLPFRRKNWIAAVEDVSLDIEEGELFGLLGPNGAGKTTLIKLLCSLVLPNAGTARIFGHDVFKEESMVKKMVGLVSAEERSFYWRLTGRENLRFYAALYHLSPRQAGKRIEELLEMVGLAGEGDMRFQNYSTGMRQKLAIARGLLSEPRVLFVDEPTRSLDPVSAQAVRRFLKESIAGHGKTVILATHNLSEAEQLCSRLAIMNRGRLSSVGSVPELRALFQTQEKCELKAGHFTEAVLARLCRLEGVLNGRIVNQGDGIATVELMISKRETVLPGILQIMVNSGAEVRDCQMRELTLEEIFLHTLHDGNSGEAA